MNHEEWQKHHLEARVEILERTVAKMQARIPQEAYPSHAEYRPPWVGDCYPQARKHELPRHARNNRRSSHDHP